jgi:hypothetical protein
MRRAKPMWRYPVTLARLWIDNVNIFSATSGTRMVLKTASRKDMAFADRLDSLSMEPTNVTITGK